MIKAAHGGHHIPGPDIQRRFSRSLVNLFHHFAQATDNTICYMNTANAPMLIFEQQGSQRTVADQTLFEQLLKEATR